MHLITTLFLQFPEARSALYAFIYFSASSKILNARPGSNFNGHLKWYQGPQESVFFVLIVEIVNNMNELILTTDVKRRNYICLTFLFEFLCEYINIHEYRKDTWTCIFLFPCLSVACLFCLLTQLHYITLAYNFGRIWMKIFLVLQ